jgi:hypothetical protein
MTKVCLCELLLNGGDADTQEARAVQGGAPKRHREVTAAEMLSKAKLDKDADRRANQQVGGPGGDMPSGSDPGDESDASDSGGTNDGGTKKSHEETSKNHEDEEKSNDPGGLGGDAETQDDRAVQDGARKRHRELKPAEELPDTKLPDTQLAKDVIDEARHAARKVRQDVKRTRKNLGGVRTKTLQGHILHDFFTIKAIYLAGFVWQPFYLKASLSVFTPRPSVDPSIRPIRPIRSVRLIRSVFPILPSDPIRSVRLSDPIRPSVRSNPSLQSVRPWAWVLGAWGPQDS